MTEKPTPVAERRQETSGKCRHLFLRWRVCWITGWIRVVARPERELTRSGALCGERDDRNCEPRGKLDASANGPKDDTDDWAEINWPQVDDDVRRLRQRIFTATRDGDLKKVRNPAEVDVAVPCQRTSQRAPGHANQRWPPHRRRGRRKCRVGRSGQGRAGLPDLTVRPVLHPVTGAAGVYTEGHRTTAATWNSGDRGPRVASTGGQRVGT